MSAVAAVFLDLYETLAWTDWPDMREEFERRIGVPTVELLEAFERTRPQRSVGAYGSLAGDLAVVLEAVGVDPEPGLVAELEERTLAFLETGVHLWDDSLPVLRELRARGLRTAIVSNCDHGTRPVIERLGLEQEADAVVLSYEVGVAKPDPAIYRATLDRLDVVRPEEVLFVDDQVVYCDGAAALGIATALIVRPRGDDPDNTGPAGEISEPGGHRVIKDLRTLLELV